MSEWIKEVPRWALYFRDDLQCAYCHVTLEELVTSPAGDNFLTLDHVLPRRKQGSNDPFNLITCCYQCNRAKRNQTLLEFCEAEGLSYEGTRAWMYRRRVRDPERYKTAAMVALGLLPGFLEAETVRAHKALVCAQWSELDLDRWRHEARARAEEFALMRGAPGPGTPPDELDDF